MVVMRISAYAERLLQGLNEIDWTGIFKNHKETGSKIGWSNGFFLM
jgi:hypothetical protein